MNTGMCEDDELWNTIQIIYKGQCRNLTKFLLKMAACCQVATERWTEIMQMNILIYILEDTKITFESEGNAMLTIDVKGEWQAQSNVQMEPRLIQ